ncbi:ranBP-type and C3HC4-type zinc finger-containing protein 1-like [Gigantopelta aegis]|uniref:ranBP-type and C3HC4-type zinc finger-containing protein 1-like n=1 Tax=Gigantopelta aegis TaxID=1735272 RepID=UPI001B88CB0A|nr:ranBP-type and C3HC4-type zinc finger-containing protein 1-like [Gigantopelta aegis]
MASVHPPLMNTSQSIGMTGRATLRGNRSAPVEQLKETSKKLEAAIQAGDLDKAKQFAEELATEKVKVNLEIDAQTYEMRLKEQSFSLKVIIEDRVSTGTCVYLTVKPSDTILDLKRRMMIDYDFPIEVQRWIISLRVCEDHRTLQHYQVKCQGCTAYLYMITAKSVHLDHEKHERNRNDALNGIPYPSEMQSGDYMTMKNPMMHTMPTNFRQTPAGADGMGEGYSAWDSKPTTPRNSGNLPSGLMSGSSEAHVEPVVEVAGGEEVPHLLTAPPPQANQQQVGWQCSACTLVNKPTRPGCEMCGSERPADYKVPEGYVLSEEERRWIAQTQETERLVQEAEREQDRQQMEMRAQNFNQMLQLDGQDLVPNGELFDCPICMESIPPGNGVVLRECLHMFCKECLMDAVRYSEEAGLKCPYLDDEYSCATMLQDREIRALVPDEMYARYLQRSLDLAESQEENSYHCKSADCPGWCIYEDMVNFFKCPICSKENCLTCKAIHEGMNCKQYQEDLRIRAHNDVAAKQTHDMLERMLTEGNAMHCPKCKVIVQKKDGCDWIKCSICKTEICWVTKGPRWGPIGEGDTSGGCQCRVNGAKCHPDCNNCH